MEKTKLASTTAAIAVLAAGALVSAQQKAPPAAPPAAKAPMGAPAAKAPAAAPAAPAAAATPTAAPPTEPPKPPAEMDNLKLFVGSWKCDGVVPAGPLGPEHKVSATGKIKMDLGGHWQMIEYAERKTKEHPMAGKAVGHWGYDPSAKKYVGAFFGHFGDWETRSSSGWEGDKLVWSGEIGNMMGAPKTAFRHTFTKKSEKELVELFEANLGGRWVSLGELTCKK